MDRSESLGGSFGRSGASFMVLSGSTVAVSTPEPVSSRWDEMVLGSSRSRGGDSSFVDILSLFRSNSEGTELAVNYILVVYALVSR